MAGLYRKKPVVIEALNWDGSTGAATAVINWMLANDGTARYHDDGPGGLHLSVDTLEGTMTASPGDWIVKGVQGEFYPCKPAIFAATYERVISDDDTLSDEDRIREAMAEAQEHPGRIVTKA